MSTSAEVTMPWHVDKGITHELRKKWRHTNRTRGLQDVSDGSRTLLDNCLRGFLNRLSLYTKTASFKKYFVEPFHKVFKYQYLKGKTNNCLANCLLNLLQYVRDKTCDRLIKLTKGKVTTCINIIQERHLRSLTLSTGSVKPKDGLIPGRYLERTQEALIKCQSFWTPVTSNSRSHLITSDSDLAKLKAAHRPA